MLLSWPYMSPWCLLRTAGPSTLVGAPMHTTSPSESPSLTSDNCPHACDNGSDGPCPAIMGKLSVDFSILKRGQGHPPGAGKPDAHSFAVVHCIYFLVFLLSCFLEHFLVFLLKVLSFLFVRPHYLKYACSVFCPSLRIALTLSLI